MNRPTIASLLLLTLLGLGACNRPEATLTPTDSSSEAASPTTVTTPAETAPAVAPGTRVAQDHILVPGQQVGQVTASTSRQQLADLYGEANLQDTEVHMGEGFMEPGTVVSIDNQPQFTVVWLDASRSRPLMARAFAPDWQISEGIGIGTPYATLQQALGNFQIYGFGWDYGGTLSLEGSQLDLYYGLLLLRAEPSQASIDAHPDAFQATLGDRLIPSTDPNLAQLDLRVTDMVVYLNEPME
ncbi:hypothetical protein GFS31_00500 [Leptolyngbya sp. BL0902]|uniref:hypothetical protein n=1 Tax=Leptolyngbya sp. BL0902 TaxID=1115757 RepID=UPI0018E82D57|nr:hypothetical protein [Leptolyngbya sp. BL0902]QQE63385.1 hypothetical protein GFS31_00500 [Leptolyngbya sp. BL0902]